MTDLADSTRSKRPLSLLRVLVHDEDGGSGWSLGELVEWRWVNEVTADWEGFITYGADRDAVWIAGSRLRRIADHPVSGAPRPR